MVDRLPQVLPPRRGESVHGFVRRLAEINGITLSAVMKLAGIGRIKPVTDDLAWDNLATAAGTTADVLTRMRWVPAGLRHTPGAITFMGHAVRPSHLAQNDMRICPSCIREGGTIMEVWSVHYVTACPRHGCQLVDTCEKCRRRLSFHSAGVEDAWACVCDKELADQPLLDANPAALDVARFLYPIVGRTEVTGYISLAKKPDERLMAFDALSLNDMLAAIDLIGTVATTPVADDKQADEGQSRYGSIGPRTRTVDTGARAEAAMRIMRGWPETWYALLDDLATRSTREVSSVPEQAILSTRMGRRCLAPDRGLDGIPLPVIADATTTWLEQRHGIVRRKRPTSARNAIALNLGRAMPAEFIASQLGIEPYLADFRRIYQDALAAMVAERVADTTEELGADLLNRVRRRWSALSATVSSVAASGMLEGFAAEKGLKGWNGPDLIIPAAGFEDLARKRRTTYLVADIERMLKRLKDVSTKVDDIGHLDHLTTVVMRRTLTPHYDKTDLLRDVLSGRVATFRTTDTARLCDLHADLREANRRTVSCRAMALMAEDVMLASKPLNNMLEVLWSPGHRLGIKESRALREGGRVRFTVETLWNATEQRSHPSYGYSVRDTLDHMTKTLGPSGIPELDDWLRRDFGLQSSSSDCETIQRA